MPAGYQNTALSPSITGGPPTAASGSANDPSWLQTLGNLTNLGGSIYGIVNSSNLSGNAATAFAQSNPFGGYRPVYGKQLLDLMQNPSSVTQLPEYQFLLNQGIQAIDRSAAAPGGKGLGSGGEMTDLLTYGQGLAESSFMGYAQLLSKLAGADINPANPAQALQAQGGAATGMGSSIAGLGSALGSTAGLLAKLFPTGVAGGSASSGLGALGGFDQFSAGSGYDPTTGQYSGVSTPSFAGFSQGSGYDPTTGQYSGGSDLSNLTLGGLGDSGGGMDTQPIDLSGMWSNPKAAGGEAATPAAQHAGMGTYIGGAQDIYGIYGGLSSGTPTGYASAAIDAGKLANVVSPGTVPGVGPAGAALGLYSGIKTGGVAGDTQAAIGAAQLGAQAGAFGGASSTVGAAAGAVALPVAVGVYAASKPAFSLDRSYWNNMMSTLRNGPSDPSYWPVAVQLETMMAKGVAGGSDIGGLENTIPPDVLALAKQLGLGPMIAATSNLDYSSGWAHTGGGSAPRIRVHS